jgi:hypothetical protein
MKKIYNKRIYITVVGMIDGIDLVSDIGIYCTIWSEHDDSYFILPLLINDYTWFFESMKNHYNEFVKFTGYLSDPDLYDFNVGLVVDTIEYLDQSDKEEEQNE